MKRTDIQALRGFSVLAVLLYHLQILRFKGGYLGVDIFFVISGFVITERLARGEGSIRVQIIDFYKRRAKRILPASLFVILLTSIAIRLFLSPLSWKRFGLDGLATTFFGGNFRFAAQGNNYLIQSMSPTPYLHYWSLGVEEQFYLAWPLVYLFFLKSRKYLIAPIFLAATSFALWFTIRSPVSSFYLPFSRAWEFLAGICIALVLKKWKRNSALLGLVGWLAVTLSILFIGSDHAVPGITTLIPVFGAMAILSAELSFSWAPALEKIGDYSYAIYLIHWPLVVIALSRYQGLSLSLKVVIALLSLSGGFLISAFIEKPLRFNPKFSLALPKWGVGLVVVAALGFATTSYATNSNIGKVKIDLSLPDIYNEKCHLEFGVSKPQSACLYGDLASRTEVVLAGDSHAAQWFSVLERLALSNHWKLLSLTKSSCPAAFMPTIRNGILDSSCEKWQRYIAERIAVEQPTKVFISSYSEYNYSIAQVGSYAENYAKDQLSFISSLKLPSSHIYLLEDSPSPKVSIPDCLTKHLNSQNSCDFQLTRSEATLAIRGKLASSGFHYLRFDQILCPNSRCTAVFAGNNTYRDSSHVSVSTANSLISEFRKFSSQV